MLFPLVFQADRIGSAVGSILRNYWWFGVFGSSQGCQSALERLDFNGLAQSSTLGPLIASRW